MKDVDSQRAWKIIGEIYERHRTLAEISPNWLATQVMCEIGADLLDNEVEYLLAHLQARQIARSFCRKRFDDDETAEPDDLFPDSLQYRYPRRPVSSDTEPLYVLRDQMNAADVAYNVARLRSEAVAKLKHADALEAWGRSRSTA